MLWAVHDHGLDTQRYAMGIIIGKMHIHMCTNKEILPKVSEKSVNLRPTLLLHNASVLEGFLR